METNKEKAMSKKSRNIIIAVVVILVLGYLVRGSFWMMGGPGYGGYGMMGGPGGVTVNRNLNGSATYSNTQGTVTVGNNALPADWPSDAPTYANAKIQYSGSSNPQTGEKGLAVVFMTTDSAQKVADFYKGQLASKGWSVEQTATMGASTVLAAKKDNRTFSVYIADSGSGQTSVTIGISTSGAQ